MKFFLIYLLFTYVIFQVEAKPTFGITGGLNFSNWKVPIQGTLDAKGGYFAGVSVDIPFGKTTEGLYLNASSVFIAKGAKESVDWGNSYFNFESEANYLEIPVHIGFRKDISDKFALFGEVGPFISFGLSGKTIENYDAEFKHKYEYNTFGSYSYDKTGDSTLEKLDYGIGFSTGCVLSKKLCFSYWL